MIWGRHILYLAVVSAFALSSSEGAFAENCDTIPLKIMREDADLIALDVAIADTNEARAQGLMYVTDLAPNAAMLFVYDHPRDIYFWMKNTLIPLDMLFADASGRVTHIHENAQPLDETPIFGGHSIQYVLEINGGAAARLEIEAGNTLHHPSIDKQNEIMCK